MKPLFLVNDRSGANRGRDLRAIIRSGCGWTTFDIATCGERVELDRIILDAENAGFDVIVAVGGDGTVHEIGKRLVGTQLALGIVPVGSGNGFARHLRIPLAPLEAVRALQHARREVVDTATANERRFLGVMGVGLDAEIAHRFARSPERGFQTYLRTGLAAIASHAAADYEIVVDGTVFREQALVLTIANASQYGNAARIAPNASVQDGLLEVVTIRRMTLFAAPLVAARLFAGSLHRSGTVTTRQGREVTIRRTDEQAHLDGEPVMLESELRIRVVPRSLVVLVPAAGRI